MRLGQSGVARQHGVGILDGGCEQAESLFGERSLQASAQGLVAARIDRFGGVQSLLEHGEGLGTGATPQQHLAEPGLRLLQGERAGRGRDQGPLGCAREGFSARVVAAGEGDQMRVEGRTAQQAAAGRAALERRDQPIELHQRFGPPLDAVQSQAAQVGLGPVRAVGGNRLQRGFGAFDETACVFAPAQPQRDQAGQAVRLRDEAL